MKLFLSFAMVASSLSLRAYAASPIDCAKASSPTEKTICSTLSLLQADARMTAYYEIAISLWGWVCVAIWVIRTLSARSPAGRAPPPPAVSRVSGLDIRPDSLPEDVGAAALALLEAERTRDALSLLYRGALSRAVHRFGAAMDHAAPGGRAG